MDGPPLSKGWLRVEGDRITAVGSSSNPPPPTDDIQTFPGCVLLPGLINMHCHLELTALHHKLPSEKSFPIWVEALRALTATMEPVDYRKSSEQGIVQLLHGGTTTVVDVGNTGEAPTALAQSSLRAVALVETLGLDPILAESRFSHYRALSESVAATSRVRIGLVPHAAYSCSPELIRAVIGFQRDRNLPITFHASESREEEELFSSASGALQEFCRSFFKSVPEHRHTTPIKYLEKSGLLPDHAMVVHGNHLDAEDIGILVERKATVVHCPSSHAFFGHKPFPYHVLRQAGVPVCLGTDSLASGDSLSMLDQVRMFRNNFPSVTAEEALRIATMAAARALGLENEIGILRTGFKADFIAVACASKTDPYESLITGNVVTTVVDGQPTASI